MSLNPTGFPMAPSIRGTLKPHTSASSTPTERPAFARAAARFTVTLDLPTPPLPDAIAMIEVCGGNEMAFSGAGRLTASELRDHRLPLLGAHRRELHVDALHALERCHGRRHVAGDPILQGTALDGQEDVHPDDTAVDLDRSQHPDLVDRDGRSRGRGRS